MKIKKCFNNTFPEESGFLVKEKNFIVSHIDPWCSFSTDTDTERTGKIVFVLDTLFGRRLNFMRLLCVFVTILNKVRYIR
jgi:hypothetical protein